jgi:glutathione synthase/RimK-type ligase-like ATP-grasp enzyme
MFMATREAIIDLEKSDPGFDIAQCLSGALRKYGKKPLSQVTDIARLALGFGKLTPQEYYDFCLYDDETFSFSDKNRFLGKRAQNRILSKSAPLDWYAIAHDKLVFYGLLSGLGFPVPKTLALFHPIRCFGEVPALREPEALARFLRQDMRYPFFAKPVSGMYSVGASSVDSFEPVSDSLVLGNGDKVGVEAYVKEVSRYFEDGYIFQERLQSHERLREVCGESIGTARVMVMVREDGAEIYQALWKVPVGDNVADNFWRPGNILASLDIESGRVLRAVQGVGLDQAEVERHPDTARSLTEIALPDWTALKSLCLKAAAALPKLSMQAWDIAMCPEGPILVEVNVGGDFNLPQIATGRGLLSDSLRDFLTERLGVTVKI